MPTKPITATALCLFVVFVSSVFSIVCGAYGGRLVHARLITEPGAEAANI